MQYTLNPIKRNIAVGLVLVPIQIHSVRERD